MFLVQQIVTLQWFLKDHVTLKTEVMAVENVALPSQEYILFKNLFKYKTFSCNNILQYYCLCCIINQTNVDLVSMRDFQKHEKNLKDSKLLYTRQS